MDLVTRLRYRSSTDLYPTDTALTLMAAAADEITQLRGNLSLAEGGLANYQQENERLRKALSGRLQENERMRDALLAIHGSTGPDGLWENKAIHGVAADGLQEPQNGNQT